MNDGKDSSIKVEINASGNIVIDNLYVAHTINNVHENTDIDANVVEQFKDALIRSYQHDNFKTIESLFSEKRMSLEDAFVNVEIIKDEEQRQKEAQAGIEHTIPAKLVKRPSSWEEIHQVKSPIDWRVLYQTHDFKKMLIMGRAGIGKSIFLKKLAYEWSKNELKGKFDWVFHLPLTEVLSNSTDNLSDVIFFHIANHQYVTKPVWDKIWREIITGKILFLFDGYDEISTKKDRKAINALMKEAENIGYYLISSRPYYLYELPSQNTRLEVMGFTHENIKEYVRKYFKEDISKQTSLLNEIRKNNNLHSLMHIPINAYFICLMWEREEIVADLSMTAIYTKIVDFLIWRYLNRSDLIDEMMSSQEIEKKLRPLLYKTALRGMQSSSLAFGFNSEVSSEEVKQLLESGLLKSTKSTENKQNRDEKSYYFIHLTIQEYLVAEYYAELMGKQDENSLRIVDKFFHDHKLDPRYSMVLIFMGGLAKQDVNSLVYYFKKLFSAPRDLLITREIALTINCLDETGTKGLADRAEYFKYLINVFNSNYFMIGNYIFAPMANFSIGRNVLLTSEGKVVDEAQIVNRMIENLADMQDNDFMHVCIELRALLQNAPPQRFSQIFSSMFKIIEDETVSITKRANCLRHVFSMFTESFNDNLNSYCTEDFRRKTVENMGLEAVMRILKYLLNYYKKNSELKDLHALVFNNLIKYFFCFIGDDDKKQIVTLFNDLGEVDGFLKWNFDFSIFESENSDFSNGVKNKILFIFDNLKTFSGLETSDFTYVRQHVNYVEETIKFQMIDILIGIIWNDQYIVFSSEALFTLKDLIKNISDDKAIEVSDKFLTHFKEKYQQDSQSKISAIGMLSDASNYIELYINSNFDFLINDLPDEPNIIFHAYRVFEKKINHIENDVLLRIIFISCDLMIKNENGMFFYFLVFVLEKRIVPEICKNKIIKTLIYFFDFSTLPLNYSSDFIYAYKLIILLKVDMNNEVNKYFINKLLYLIYRVPNKDIKMDSLYTLTKFINWEGCLTDLNHIDVIGDIILNHVDQFDYFSFEKLSIPIAKLFILFRHLTENAVKKLSVTCVIIHRCLLLDIPIFIKDQTTLVFNENGKWEMIVLSQEEIEYLQSETTKYIKESWGIEPYVSQLDNSASLHRAQHQYASHKPRNQSQGPSSSAFKLDF